MVVIQVYKLLKLTELHTTKLNFATYKFRNAS